MCTQGYKIKSLSNFSKTESLVRLELSMEAGLAGQLTPRICLFELPSAGMITTHDHIQRF